MGSATQTSNLSETQALYLNSRELFVRPRAYLSPLIYTAHAGPGSDARSPSTNTLEIFIPFEKYKRCTKRKSFVIWVASHFTYNIVMCKRVKLNSYEPFVRDKTMKFVTHSWYNKRLSFGTPFVFLKTYKNFQCYLWDKRFSVLSNSVFKREDTYQMKPPYIHHRESACKDFI